MPGQGVQFWKVKNTASNAEIMVTTWLPAPDMMSGGEESIVEEFLRVGRLKSASFPQVS